MVDPNWVMVALVAAGMVCSFVAAYFHFAVKVQVTALEVRLVERIAEAIEKAVLKFDERYVRLSDWSIRNAEVDRRFRNIESEADSEAR